ncbi:hypothetical protein IGI04_019279 [Brassica rapa subsp. trilocularis]|uniref:Uncharacterized protein n=1 Tax=Brassica rapa subsp. trilocularis TaxID=1813537 RepID=A0ABQ7MHS2_BRACM|nr:hypothetical protein IGI04_019279 [Brassica rapa subsp. trilocularis]
MSLDGSQWCRPMSMNSHRSTDHDEDRWTDYSSHRTTSFAKLSECKAVRILTHEEFAAKHSHPPSTFYDKIDQSVEPTIDRQSESNVDRHNTPPIDRQAPLTYRLQLPSIDNDYINALRPPPKSLANPPEPKPNSLNSSPEPVQEEQENEGRRLRKRKEKIPKNLKREANDKEMDGFTKRVLRIPIEKPFDEAYFTHRLWIFFRETKVINSVDCGKELGFIGACHCGAKYELEYEIEYSESIDNPTFPSIDSNDSTVTDDRNNTSLDIKHPVDHFAPPNHCYQHFAFQPPSKRGLDDYSIGSWAYSGFHESYAADTVITSPNEEHTEEYDEDYWEERAIEMSLQDERLETHKFTNKFPTSIAEVHSTSVDTHPRPAKQPLTSIGTHTGTSIDIRAAAKIQEQENIPSPTRDPDGNARAIDGRILQVSREDIADILQVANGPDNLFSQQRQASIDGTTEASIDRVTPTSIVRDDPTSIDRRYEFRNRAFDMYGARKFTWEQRDEYGVYRDECGHAQGVAGEMIPVTKDDIRKLLERASLFEDSHICLPEQATSFTLTRLAPELYTKDEINEMVLGICGAQEKLGEELKTLQLEKEATTSASIDSPHATSIDASLPTAQIPAEPQCSVQHKYEWEVSYIDTRINDMYYPLNNNVDWLSTKIELLPQDLDTIRKKNQQPATSIDMCTFTSLDAKVSAMNERLRTYEDMHDRFISPWTRQLQKEVKAIHRQLAAQQQISASIERTQAKSIDGNSPRSTNEHLIASIDAESTPIGEQLIHKTIESMQKELTELSAYAYDNIGWHQVTIDNVQERLQNISNVLEKMDEKWTNSTKDAKADQPINYTLALNRHFTRAKHVEVDERKNNRSMRISAVGRYQEMPRQMKLNIDRCKQVPSIDIETSDTRHLDSADLKPKAKPNYQNALTSF